MDEQAALGLLGEGVDAAGDDAAIVDGTVLTIDMLHEKTDFPPGTSRYTAGWRAVGVSLSDIAAMGAEPTAAVAAYGSPDFEESALESFVQGAKDVSAAVDTTYVGGDLDQHEEFTVATAAVGRASDPVPRTGASQDEVVCVTGTLGRSAAAIRAFQAGAIGLANDLFQFTPRVAAGRTLAEFATAMMDSSDGLARSLHQLGDQSDVGFRIDGPAVPIHEELEPYLGLGTDPLEEAITFGEDFELVCTLPEDTLDSAREAVPCALTRIGTVTEAGVTLDGDPLPDRGYTHG